MSLECPRRLYYAYDKDVYANQDSDDEFLKSLAEGGFQVGEFAKLCYGIGAERTVKTLEPADAIRQTKELLSQDNVNIAEAAFLKDNMFVRADIIEKKGNIINQIEVKEVPMPVIGLPDGMTYLNLSIKPKISSADIGFSYLASILAISFAILQCISSGDFS